MKSDIILVKRVLETPFSVLSFQNSKTSCSLLFQTEYRTYEIGQHLGQYGSETTILIRFLKQLLACFARVELSVTMMDILCKSLVMLA